jgi:hypothetical protein
VVARIRRLDAAGATLTEIANTIGVSTFSVRAGLGRVPAKTTTGVVTAAGDDTAAGAHTVAGGEAVEAEAEPGCAAGVPGESATMGDEGPAGAGVGTGCAATGPDDEAALGNDDHSDADAETACPASVSGDEIAQGSDTATAIDTATATNTGGWVGGLPVLPDVVARAGERGLARTGLLECAAPVFTPGAKYPLAGLLLILPALASTGLLEVARTVYGRLRNGFYLDHSLACLSS